ncbi:MAG: MBL fold metallo-hydrolase [Candidatus Eisenbacteria sp.]|nr:MBL fold metallo-hydrolase [Candidatus Eisenbacteria bacterium]
MMGQSLHVIDLDMELVGYRKFLSCWVYLTEDLTFIIDPGPAVTADHLIASLRALGVSRLDFILNTHIHLDHSGGVAEVVRAYPGARVLCHERGVEHLINPSRLWEGSRNVLGTVAEAYGPPMPMPEGAVADPADVNRAGIAIVPTPGHASHHLSFIHDAVLFAGEVAGLHAHLPGRIYLRPATPPRFILDVALDSIDRLLALDPMPQQMVFAHYGMVDDPKTYLVRGREQLVRWVDLVRELTTEFTGSTESTESIADLSDRAHERLLEIDPYYANFAHLEPDTQARERYYLKQTIQGMLGYVRP